MYNHGSGRICIGDVKYVVEMNILLTVSVSLITFLNVMPNAEGGSFEAPESLRRRSPFGSLESFKRKRVGSGEMTKRDMNAYKNAFNPKPFDPKEHQHHHKSSKNESKPPEDTGRDPNTSSSHRQLDNGDSNAARSQNSHQQDQSQSQAMVTANNDPPKYNIDESIRQGLHRRNMSLKEYDELLGALRDRQGKTLPKHSKGKSGKGISKDKLRGTSKDKLRVLSHAISAAKRNKNRTHSNRTGSLGHNLQGKPAANNTKISNTGGDSPLAKTGAKHKKKESPDEVARLKKRLERYNDKQKKKGTFECKDRSTTKYKASDRCAKIKKKRACNRPTKAGVYARYRFCMVTCGTCTPADSEGHSPKKGKGKKA
ncbi:hypothetical protein DdX_10807 [Ditylenchus destructor]|uniref:Uncharacterized protein n=1 Tax=Ditylenchus destructor TaxID=166010 RepID=A0AAD4MX61_9BILA|nr:hypothetical protein DdX_10807 [Ditylenchus destructor]